MAFGGVYFVYGDALFSGGSKRYNGLVETVKKEKLVIRIVERGELESAFNSDVICRVKAGSRKSPILIKSVIDDGTIVEKDQVLVQLDTSVIEDELKDQQIVMDQAEAAKIKAEQEYEITKSQNESDVLAAKTALKIAELDLLKFKEGDNILQMQKIENDKELAFSDFTLWQERVDWAQRMSLKGFISPSQVAAEKASQLAAKYKYENLVRELEVYKKYTQIRDNEDLKSKVKEATLALDRAIAQAKSKEIQALTEKKTKESVYLQEKSKYDEIVTEIANCTIRAPQSGLAIYYVPSQSRFGRGNQTLVAEGEPIQFNQKLMQIPDLSRMQVKARIHEAMVSYLHDADTSNPSSWQPAFIRVDAFPDVVLPAHVKSVATIASQQDWLSSDVKVYETVITIDKSVDDLKPGMSAEVTIIAYESPEPVLTIPIQAVVGTITMGKTRKCFVVDKDGRAEMRDIVLGMSNSTVVEVKEGLTEGEQVAADPSSLISSDSRLKAGKAGKTRGINPKEADFEGGKKPAKGAGNKGGQKPGNGTKAPNNPGVTQQPNNQGEKATFNAPAQPGNPPQMPKVGKGAAISKRDT